MIGRSLSAARRLAALGAAALSAALLLPHGTLPRAYGQQPALPPTTVEGARTPGTPTTTTPAPPLDQPPEPNPNDFPPPTPPTNPGASIGAGGPFASPPADGYRAGDSTTGTLTNTPSLNIPGVVTVVPSAVIQDQQAIRMDDLLRDIPGAVKSFDTGYRADAFNLRGFTVQAGDYRWNGFRDPSDAPRDLYNVQRVEILQGPASVLYGAGQPSGLVNFITKKPLDQYSVSADVQGGSYDFFRTTVDATGPIDADGRLLFRLNASYLNTNSFRDFVYEERTSFDPVLTYLLDENTAITAEFQYLKDRRLIDTGVVAPGGTPAPAGSQALADGFGILGGNPGLVPRSAFYGQPTDYQHFEDFKEALTFVHKFNDDWALKVGGFVGTHSSPFFATIPENYGNDPSLAPLGLTFPPNTILREPSNFDVFREQNYDFKADLAGKFETGSIKHNFVVGYEYDYFRSKHDVFELADEFTSESENFGPPFGIVTVPTGASSPIGVYNRNYNLPQPTTFPSNINAIVTQLDNAVYAQDEIQITPKFRVLAGVRYDVLQQDYQQSANLVEAGNALPPADFENSLHSYYSSPRIGLVYQPIDQVLSFYGNYSASFDPASSGIFVPGTQLRPEVGRSGEGGMKLDLLDKRLSITATGFYAVKDNVVQQTGFIFSEQIGEQRSQGAQLSAVGKLTDQWSVIANYAYIDSRILASVQQAEVGQRFLGVPYNSANIWSRYNLLQDEQQTFGVALGMVYNGDRPGDLIDSFELGSYVRWDGGVYYQRGVLRASLYLENIFDKNYYAGSLNNLSVYPGNPFTLRAQLGVKF